MHPVKSLKRETWNHWENGTINSITWKSAINMNEKNGNVRVQKELFFFSTFFWSVKKKHFPATAALAADNGSHEKFYNREKSAFYHASD